MFFCSSNKKVDIKFSAHDAFLEQLSSGTLKAKILESQIIKKISLGAGKSKRRNRIAKFCYGHLCLSDEYLSFKIFQLGIKTYLFHLVLMTRSWTNLDKLFSESQDSKASKAKQQVFGNKYSKGHVQDISKWHAHDIF